MQHPSAWCIRGRYLGLIKVEAHFESHLLELQHALAAVCHSCTLSMRSLLGRVILLALLRPLWPSAMLTQHLTMAGIEQSSVESQALPAEHLSQHRLYQIGVLQRLTPPVSQMATWPCAALPSSPV
jgi:hypothetical protein